MAVYCEQIAIGLNMHALPSVSSDQKCSTFQRSRRTNGPQIQLFIIPKQHLIIIRLWIAVFDECHA